IQKAHALQPDDPRLNYTLAYLLAVCPDPKTRDPMRAVALAKKAAGAAPGAWETWGTLGVAHYRAGNPRAAVAALTRPLQPRPASEPFQYFPLAAACQQQGHNEEARKWYERGVSWMAANKHPYVAELALFRADAEAALGIRGPVKPSAGKGPAQK